MPNSAFTVWVGPDKKTLGVMGHVAERGHGASIQLGPAPLVPASRETRNEYRGTTQIGAISSQVHKPDVCCSMSPWHPGYSRRHLPPLRICLPNDSDKFTGGSSFSLPSALRNRTMVSVSSPSATQTKIPARRIIPPRCILKPNAVKLDLQRNGGGGLHGFPLLR